MFLLNKYLAFSQSNKKELLNIKLMVLIIVNLWLLVIFWKIILLEGKNITNITNNNIALTKMNTWLNPILEILGLNVLSPNSIKMMLISTIIIGVNLSVLYFNQIIILGILGLISRYSYKSYTNYLINKENLNYLGFETIKPVKEEIITQVLPKVVEQVPIIINTGSSTGTNWWLWGTVIVVGVIAVAGIALAIWFHNTNANNNNISNLTEQASWNALNKQRAEFYRLKDTERLKKGCYESNTLEIAKETKPFFGHVLESNTAIEAMILTTSKLFEGFTLLKDKLNIIEAKVNVPNNDDI